LEFSSKLSSIRSTCFSSALFPQQRPEELREQLHESPHDDPALPECHGAEELALNPRHFKLGHSQRWYEACTVAPHGDRLNEGRLKMSSPSTLHDLFLDELRDLYNAEKQLTDALLKLARAATASPLTDAFKSHHQETVKHVERLEQVFSVLGEGAREKECEGIAGILDEGEEIMAEDFDGATMDAALIAAAQRAEHYEIAAYGTVVAWAQAMGHDEVVGLLAETLAEEKAADEKLTSLAAGGINQEAAAIAHPEPQPQQAATTKQARKKVEQDAEVEDRFEATDN
jgi:ferritin-like metal-binding protein YciE